MSLFAKTAALFVSGAAAQTLFPVTLCQDITEGDEEAVVFDLSHCEEGGVVRFAEFDVVVQGRVVACIPNYPPVEPIECPGAGAGRVKFDPAATENITAGCQGFFVKPASPDCTCFPSESTLQVQGKVSPQRLSLLQIGDRVLADDTYTDIIGFLHDVRVEARMLTLEHDAGEVRASAPHMLFTTGKAQRADELVLGDVLVLSDDALSVVRAIRQDTTTSVRAPLTLSGAVMVDSVRASSYASIADLSIPHAASHASLWLARCMHFLFSVKPHAGGNRAGVGHTFHSFVLAAFVRFMGLLKGQL